MLPRGLWRVGWAVCPAVSEGYSRGAVTRPLEGSVVPAGCVRQFRGGTIEALPRGLWRVQWAQGGVCPAVSGRYNRGAATRPLGSVGPGRCVSGSFGAVYTTWRAGGGYKYIARLEHFYKQLTKCCNLPYKWC